MTGVVADAPVVRVSCGVPPEVTTVTGSVKVTVTGTACDALYDPSASVEVTPVTVADVVSRLYDSVVPETVALARALPAASTALLAGTTVRPSVAALFDP